MSDSAFRNLACRHRPGAFGRGLLALLGGLAALALLATPAAATPLDLASLSRQDLRAEAMGNAFSAVARGETALVYNPAGLVQYPFDIKLDAGLAAQGEAGSFFKDTYNLMGSTASVSSVQSYLTKYLGKSQYYQALTNYNAVANLSTFHVGFGAGSLHVERYGFSFQDNGSTPGTFDLTDHLTLSKEALRLKTVAFAFNSFDGQLLTGLTLKRFTYTAGSASSTFQNVLLSGNIQLSTTDTAYTGSGYDLGFLWRMQSLPFLHGQWSLVANNLGGISLQNGASTVTVPSSYDVGFSVSPPIPIVHVILAVSMDDVTGAIKVQDGTGVDHKRSTQQRMHMGAEVGLFETTTGNNILNLRIGENRGGATSGFEINLFSGMRLIYTRYKDDYGYSGHPDQHSFQTVQLSLGFGF